MEAYGSEEALIKTLETESAVAFILVMLVNCVSP